MLALTLPLTQVEEEQERAYLTCRFHLARAYGKLETAESLASAQKEYELIDAYFSRQRVDGMEQEAQVA